MLTALQRLACLVVASDTGLAVRWVPSEANAADKDSRQWEPTGGAGEGLSRKEQISEALRSLNAR
eukprot:13222955-Alexandrium_andersonii.AAC.1